MNKKAIFFTVASLFVVILFVAGSGLTSQFRIGESELEVTRTRIRIFNSIIKDMQDVYFSKLLYLSSKNAIVGLSRYYSENNFANIEYELWKSLSMVAPKGEYMRRNGNNVSLISLGHMDYDYTIEGQMENISERLDSLGINVEYLRLNIISLEQIDPWTIQVEGEVDYYFKDKQNMASWKGFATVFANVSVYGVYLFDYANYPSSTRTNFGRVNDSWNEDLASTTEPSALKKLGGSLDRTGGMGICSLYFIITDKDDPNKKCNCRNDSLCRE